jgi:hypothetical protein
MLVLLIEEIYEVRHWNSLSWHDIPTKFHDDRFRHLSNIINTATIWEAVMLVLTDRRDLWSLPLRWLRVSWYSYQDLLKLL